MDNIINVAPSNELNRNANNAAKGIEKGLNDFMDTFGDSAEVIEDINSLLGNVVGMTMFAWTLEEESTAENATKEELIDFIQTNFLFTPTAIQNTMFYFHQIQKLLATIGNYHTAANDQ